ncbi:hypothetical protein H4R34_004161 [Dimargaris verticillata]|uniref:Histidine kinase n=1 Tax=Dimargaris verticillata TaxID=2761393 RepID=A0A9W8EBE1_9FUNG|nr:hypothetical protein H4R34_004161 [Dimargaris verticillata]
MGHALPWQRRRTPLAPPETWPLDDRLSTSHPNGRRSSLSLPPFTARFQACANPVGATGPLRSTRRLRWPPWRSRHGEATSEQLATNTYAHPTPAMSWSNRLFAPASTTELNPPAVAHTDYFLTPHTTVPLSVSPSPLSTPKPAEPHIPPSAHRHEAHQGPPDGSLPAWWAQLKQRYFSSWLAFCQYVLPVVVVLLGVGISIGVFFVFKSISESNFSSNFRWRCRERSVTLANDFLNALQAAQGYQALYQSVFTISNDKSLAFAKYALVNTNLYYVGQCQLVTRQHRTTFEQAENATILQYMDDAWAPAADADWYCPLMVVYPTNTGGPLGYDLLADENGQAAAKSARESLVATLSGPLTLYSNATNSSTPLPDVGVSVYYPLYPNDGTASTTTAKSSSVSAFVVAAYRIQASFDRVLNTFQSSDMLISVWDVPTQQLLYNSSISGEPDDTPAVSYKEKYTILDRQWLFQCVSTEDVTVSPMDKVSITLMVIMMLFALTLAVILRTFVRQFFKARKTVADQHVELGKSHAINALFSQQSQATLQAVADPLLALNCQGYILAANDHVLSLTGYSRTDLRCELPDGTASPKVHIRELLVSLSDEHFDQPCAFHHGAQPVRATMFEVSVGRKNGTRFVAEANFSQVISSTHPQCLQVLVFRDITERKTAKRAILEAKHNAEQANASKGAFLAFLCHEIRNPAHVIMGYAEMLRSSLGPGNTAVQEELRWIETAAEFMGVMVNDVLDLTRMSEANVSPVYLQPTPVDLAQVATRCAKRQRTLAADRKVAFSFTVDPCLPSPLLVDQYRLSQALTKLLEYVLEDQAPGGTTHLAVDLLEQNAASSTVTARFVITDSGSALAKEKMNYEELIAQPFALDKNSLGAKFFSAGVAKTLALTIIRMMGGSLHVSHESDGQHRCHFDLCFVQSDASSPASPTSLSSGSSRLTMRDGSQTPIVPLTPDPPRLSKSLETSTCLPLARGSLSDPNLARFAKPERPHQATSLVPSARASLPMAKDSSVPAPPYNPAIAQMTCDMAWDFPVWRPRPTRASTALVLNVPDRSVRLDSFLPSSSGLPNGHRSSQSEWSRSAATAVPTPQQSLDSTLESSGNVHQSPQNLAVIDTNGMSPLVSPPAKKGPSKAALLAKLRTPRSVPPSFPKAIAEDRSPTAPSANRHVLLVEDNLTCQLVTGKMLRRNGFQVDIANHGQEAVDKVTATMDTTTLGSKAYACIVMDVVMPIMDGCDATVAIRSLGYQGPIIALTANSIESERQRCLDSGMTAFMTKPVREKVLIALVNQEITGAHGNLTEPARTDCGPSGQLVTTTPLLE